MTAPARPGAPPTVREQLLRLGGRVGGEARNADRLVRATSWPAPRVFRAGPDFVVEDLALGVVPFDMLDVPIGEEFFAAHPDAVCLGHGDSGATLVYLPGTGDPENPTAHLFDSTGDDVSGPTPLAELLAGVELDVAASGLAAAPDDGFFRAWDGTAVFVFNGSRVLRLADGKLYEVDGSGVPYDADDFAEANGRCLKERLAVELPPAGTKHGPVPPVAGRFFRAANDSLVFVRAVRGDAAEVLVLTGGGGWRDLSPGEEYQVDRRGLYSGADRFELRPVLSLREMLSLPTNGGWGGPAEEPAPRAATRSRLRKPPRLSAAVVRHVKRLGGTFAPERASPRAEVWDGVPVPEPLRRFLRDVTWPDGVEYTNHDSGTLRVWAYSPGCVGLGDPAAYRRLRYYPEAVGIGINDGGNYTLFTLLDCDDPADPPVYRLDHDEYDAEPYGPVRLSEFLSELRPNTGDDDD